MREQGFYWVNDGDDWDIAYWSGYSWWDIGSEDTCGDESWVEIDERRIVREEHTDER